MIAFLAGVFIICVMIASIIIPFSFGPLIGIISLFIVPKLAWGFCVGVLLVLDTDYYKSTTD